MGILISFIFGMIIGVGLTGLYFSHKIVISPEVFEKIALKAKFVEPLDIKETYKNSTTVDDFINKI